MKSAIVVFLLAFCSFHLRAASEGPSVSPEGERVMQFLKDPADANRGWILTQDTLQFNSQWKSSKWKIKFDRRVFRSLVAGAAGDGYFHRRIQFSQARAGSILLLLESDGANYLFRTTDYGETWKYSALGRPQPAQGAARPIKKGKDDEVVDLGSLNSETEGPKADASSAVSKSIGSGPTFKAIFDLLLHLRPGISPWTFDNYHTLLLVDFIPKPDIQLSFEVSAAPRFYEIQVKPLPRLEIRAGRIWIPFDDMNPHNTFGGFMNTSLVRHPGGIAFLPDLWTDLGVAARYSIIDAKDISVVGHFYIVNGFQSGGVDPVGAAPSYPNFSGGSTVDNNTDKAFGFRMQLGLVRTFSVGVSAYTGRYTNDSDESRRVLMLGVDSQLRFPPAIRLRFGYTLMSVGLPTGGSATSFTRGGLYAEGKFSPYGRWYLALKGGIQQADDRVTDVNDLVLVGARVGYETDWYDLSLQHHKDLKEAPGKVNSQYTAARFVVML